jgi:two-component system response regulator GlrR
MLRRLLLIEEDALTVEASLSRLLTRERGFACERETWGTFEVEKLPASGADLVITVTLTHHEYSLEFHNWLRAHPIRAPVLVILPEEPGEVLLRSARESGDDFLLCPIRDEELQCRLARLLGETTDAETSVRCKLNKELGLEQLVGEAPEFLQEIAKIPAIASSRAPALLLGETGTGKELCAHAIHSLSSRHVGPFVPVDCGTMPEQLVENELFGHARGAFTDAHSDQKGLAAMAHGGTLFLDEIDSLTLAAQSKLLRFIEDGTYRPLGSQRHESADVRLIAATNRDLEECSRAGTFRRDLYFRLNVLPLRLPPLRKRREDIVSLTNHFIKTAGASHEKKFTPSALRILQNYDWPGNVRELFNVVRRAIAFSGSSAILPAHLGLAVNPECGLSECAFNPARQRVIENFEKQYVEDLLRKHHGNVTRAAIDARKDRRVFGRLMKKYQIDRLDM